MPHNSLLVSFCVKCNSFMSLRHPVPKTAQNLAARARGLLCGIRRNIGIAESAEEIALPRW